MLSMLYCSINESHICITSCGSHLLSAQRISVSFYCTQCFVLFVFVCCWFLFFFLTWQGLQFGMCQCSPGKDYFCGLEKLDSESKLLLCWDEVALRQWGLQIWSQIAASLSSILTVSQLPAELGARHVSFFFSQSKKKKQNKATTKHELG